MQFAILDKPPLTAVSIEPQRSLTCYELCFSALYPGRSFMFPCNPEGIVQLDQMSERARNNYFFARAMVGNLFDFPKVVEHAG